MSLNNKKLDIKKMVLGAIMTSFVIILQLLATFTAFFGPFSTAVALIPIVIGAALCGPAVGTWLGFVFGVVVLASGGGAFFFTFSIPGTVITVLAKGAVCGLVAGLVYKAFSKMNQYIGVLAAALACPVANTGVFMLGCVLFFLKDATEIAKALGSEASGIAVFVALAFGNFLIEIGMNVVLSPIILRLLNIKNKI